MDFEPLNLYRKKAEKTTQLQTQVTFIAGGRIIQRVELRAQRLEWIKDLNVRLDTIKLLEENIGRTLFDINHSKIFFDPPPRVMEIKTKITNGT